MQFDTSQIARQSGLVSVCAFAPPSWPPAAWEAAMADHSGVRGGLNTKSASAFLPWPNRKNPISQRRAERDRRAFVLGYGYWE